MVPRRAGNRRRPAARTSTRSCCSPARELIWDAGPPSREKGAGLCHGTAGNGYAFLKTFERTGDEQWLGRARAFAMHALGAGRAAAEPRYSLFTGGIGAALYTADCLDARARFPIVDGLDST